MTAASFDTLKYANTLKAAGVPEKQAEAQAAILAEAFAVNFNELATKDDLALLRTEMQSDLRETEQRLNAKFDALAAKVDGQINSLAAKVDGQINSLAVKIDGQMTLLKWMIGLAISLSVAVLIRLFVVRIP
jgi:hypothetical protein